jgi:hypothetical protein
MEMKKFNTGDLVIPYDCSYPKKYLYVVLGEDKIAKNLDIYDVLQIKDFESFRLTMCIRSLLKTII